MKKVFKSFVARTSSKKIGSEQPSSFGQQRAATIDTRMKKASEERRRLARAQYAAPAPVNKVLEEKGKLVGRSIDRLYSERKQNNSDLKTYRKPDFQE